MVTWGIYWHYLDEGDEVPPDAALFEYSYSGGIPRDPLTYDPRPRKLNYRRRDTHPPIFLNYRQKDSEAHAGRLHEALGLAFGGTDQVFMDQFSVIGGEPFPWALQQSAAHCSVMIVLIGPQWLAAADQQGRRRLDNEADYVRREITAALDRRVGVIPILVDGAQVPDAAALPAEMAGLEQLQMLPLTARNWRTDLDGVLAATRSCLDQGEQS